ncbi:hypothetical protein B0G84_2237 [Paraburkholderia sp. BL8N3]|nr:hypothetical protein B0G84_2237 [Paraburkholderia sp. BL8N3]
MRGLPNARFFGSARVRSEARVTRLTGNFRGAVARVSALRGNVAWRARTEMCTGESSMASCPSARCRFIDSPRASGSRAARARPATVRGRRAEHGRLAGQTRNVCGSRTLPANRSHLRSAARASGNVSVGDSANRAAPHAHCSRCHRSSRIAAHRCRRPDVARNGQAPHCAIVAQTTNGGRIERIGAIGKPATESADERGEHGHDAVVRVFEDVEACVAEIAP